MDKQELKEYISHNNKGGSKIRESHIRSHYLDTYNKILEFHKTHFNLNELSWKNMVYNYINDIFEIPKCKNNDCNNRVNFEINKNKYFDFCSNNCVNKSKEVKNKRKKTNVEKYGYENPMKNIDISNKSKLCYKHKCIDDKNMLQEINKKRKETSLKNFGVDNPNKSTKVRDKIKKTCVEKYGYESNLSHPEIIDKIKETNKKRYGCDNPMKNEEIKNKLNESCINKYGKKRYVLTDAFMEDKKIINKNKFIEIVSNYLNINKENVIVNDNDIKIKKYCNIHDEFIITKKNFYNRINQKISNICTKCNPINEQSSINEKEIFDYISDNLLKVSEKLKINNYEIDIFISEHNLGIEYDGLYWHSSIFKDKKYHLNKTILCENNGIQLLHIFEDEWINKKEIVKSIIKNKLGVSNNKIFARKCKIVEIDSKTSKKFLDDNHIQGNVNAKIKLGLFYENELVSLMTFGQKRVAMGNKNKNNGEYEMLRFCNKLNTIVVGGASKLLKYFINGYNPESILTFADRRYSNGNLYKQLGFEYIGNTEPNYFYVNKNSYLKREHRFKYRKDVLIKNGYDSNKTEHQIMDERGFYRIYDCGHMKFILKK